MPMPTPRDIADDRLAIPDSKSIFIQMGNNGSITIVAKATSGISLCEIRKACADIFDQFEEDVNKVEPVFPDFNRGCGLYWQLHALLYEPKPSIWQKIILYFLR